ncbi:MAG: DUF1349 domain-containing protein [Candidatus Poribacteria bacterium]|nr:DUF1349 domain-containing protein [Candidatus Poribacteria bacterium]
MPPNIPRLIVEVCQQRWFGGRRGIVLEPVPDTRSIGFTNTITSVRIFKGPGYGPGANVKAIFYEDVNYKGNRLVLGPGYYHNLHQLAYNFDNRISSINFASESYVDGPEWGSVPLILDLFDQPNYKGVRTTVNRDEPQMTARVSNTVRSMRLYKGPNCPPIGARVQLFSRPFYEGEPHPIQLTRQDSLIEIPDMRLLPQTMPEVIGSIKIEGWTSSSVFSQVVYQDEFDSATLRAGWEWHDPRELNAWQERQGFLILTVEKNQDLWHGANYDAPRVLRSETGDFAIETRLQVSGETNPHGGLIVWFDQDHFVRLEKTSPEHYFAGDVRFEQHTARRDEPLIGRGIDLENATQLYLRIERVGNLFHGYASASGVDWVSCGTAYVEMGNPVRVGMHALCPGNMKTTVTRFDYFKVMKKPEETLTLSRAMTTNRAQERSRRVETIRRLT